VNTNTWTWVAGNSTYDEPGIYGEKGKASADNIIGARQGAVGWYDSTAQEFWVFGGFGYNSTNISGGGAC